MALGCYVNDTRVERLFEILYEDPDLLVVNKPADLVCHPTKGDVHSSLISRVRLHVGEKFPAHLVNRLDRETSGVVVVAKHPEVARQLAKLWEGRAVEKTYWAIVRGHVREESGLIEAPLGKDERSEVAIKDCVRPDGQSAQTEFEVARRFTRAAGDFTWLRLRLLTGRKHQLRIHLQHFGHPIVGEKLYGGDEQLYLDLVNGRLTEEQRRQLLLPCAALHARELRFHWARKDWHFIAEPERWFMEFLDGETAVPGCGGGLT